MWGFGLWVLGVLGGLRGCLCFVFCGSGLVGAWVSGFGILWRWVWVCGFSGIWDCCGIVVIYSSGFLGLAVLGWFVWVVCVSCVLGGVVFVFCVW